VRILNLDGRYFVEPFRKLGHQVLTIGYEPDCDLALDAPLSPVALVEFLRARSFAPDLVVWADLAKPPAVIGFEALPALTVCFSIDQYYNPWHIPFAAGFDVVLVAQHDYVEFFRDERFARHIEWFPLFADAARDRDLGLARDVDAVFVGTLDPPLNPGRKPLLEAVKHQAPLVVLHGEYVELFNRARIVLNQSAAGELNFRVFEAMGCGAALVTERTENGLRRLFTPGEHVLEPYPRGDAEAAATSIRQGLADPARLADIALQGRREVMRSHTNVVRARRILKLAQEFIGTEVHRFRHANQPLVRRETAQAFLSLAVDEELRLTPELRRFYADLGREYAA
jgi:glycosyltransferase involved in cell wall biosynthesis